MSWDVFILKFDKIYKTAEEIPNDATGLILGDKEVIRKQISIVFEHTDWTDPEWGIWESDAGSIEFNIGREEQVTGITLHVRAADSVFERISILIREYGWQAIDTGSGGFADQQMHPEEGIRKWRTFRDYAIDSEKPSKDGG